MTRLTSHNSNPLRHVSTMVLFWKLLYPKQLRARTPTKKLAIQTVVMINMRL